MCSRYPVGRGTEGWAIRRPTRSDGSSSRDAEERALRREAFVDPDRDGRSGLLADRLAELGLHRKRCALLNVRGFYDPLLALFDGAVRAGFIRPATRGIVFASDDPKTLLDRLATPPIDLPEATWLRSAEQT